MVAMDKIDRRRSGSVKTRAGDERRSGNLRKERRL
jgi:hypothetical protein